MLSKLYRVFCALCFLLSIPISCDITPVPSTDNTGQIPAVCADGNSAFETIQAAIDGSQAGSVIDVCPGTYTENLLIQKNITLRAQEGNGSTIIEGATETSTISIVAVDDPGVIIEGFTIRGGNNAMGLGGGILCRESTLTLVDNAITDNSALNGGGVGVKDCSVEIKGNQIFSNQAQNRGGGTFISTSQGTVEQNEIFDNTAQEGGGMAIISARARTFLSALMEMTTQMTQNLPEGMDALSNLAEQFFNPDRQPDGQDTAQNTQGGADEPSDQTEQPLNPEQQPDDQSTAQNAQEGADEPSNQAEQSLNPEQQTDDQLTAQNMQERLAALSDLAAQFFNSAQQTDAPSAEQPVTSPTPSMTEPSNRSYEPDSLMIKNNTIRNNSASPPRSITYFDKESGGGGIWLSGNSPLVENTIRDNRSSINGGGLYIVNARGNILGNEISGNVCFEDGAGVQMSMCGGRFADNSVTENRSIDDAGGLRVYFGINMLIENNIFSENTARDASGGVKLSHSRNRFINNTLENNRADTGGALDLDNDASTVIGCTFKNNEARLGAAIHSKFATSPVLIQDTIFEGNIAEEYGGAIHFEDNAYPVTLTGIEAYNNQALKGGVIATNNSNLDIADSIFNENSAGNAGGALFLSGYEELLQNEPESVEIEVTTNEEEPKLVKLRRVRMEGNSAPTGGAIFATQHTLFDAANLIVVNNTAAETGGGMSLITPHGLIAASVIKSNTAPSAAGLLLSEPDQLEIRSCIITDNLTGEGILAADAPAAVYYSDVYNNHGGDYAGMPPATGSNGNISQDPGFINAEGPEYRLKADSPCVDTGDPNIELRDMDQTRSDMGAYAGPDGNWANSGTAEAAPEEIDQEATDQETVQEVTDQEADQETVQEVTDQDADQETVQEVTVQEADQETVQEVTDQDADQETVQEVTVQEADQETVQEVTDQDADQETVQEVTDQETTDQAAIEETDDTKDELVIIDPKMESNQD